MSSAEHSHHRFAIVGSGFAGLGMAIALKREGIEDFVLLERAEDLGGTWRDNTYPGCACDVPSHLYSFSFAPNPDWTETFSGHEEIWLYLRSVAAEHEITPHLRFGHEVRGAHWSESTALWEIETGAGTFTAEFLIAGAGGLADPRLPEIEGIEGFTGRIFHSARWDHGHDLTGRRVGVIGTGASAIQFVPEIQPQVAELHLFQRTAPWVMPRRSREISAPERRLYRALPAAQRLVRGAIYWARELFVLPLMHPRMGALPERAARRHMRAQVSDPALRAKLEPGYRMGCKRILISSDYYPALTQPNVEVVTDAIRSLTVRGVVTEDGRERELDTIILATGFHVTDVPIGERIHGGDGRSLAEVWQGSPHAYLGTTVAGFPNLFLLVGPNTGLGHNSIVFMIESQVRYVMECLRHLGRSGLGVVEVREETERRYNEGLQRRLAGTVWNSGGCASWYLDRNGRNTTIWPGSSWPFRRRLSTFDPGEYSLRPRGGHAESAAARSGELAAER